MTSPGGVNLATAYINIVPSVHGIDRSMQQAGEKAGKGFAGSFGGSLKGIGVALGGALAIRALKDYAKESIASLARIETLNSQTAQVIKTTGAAAGVSAKHIDDLSGRLENVTRTEKETIQGGANLLLTFTNLKNGVGKGNQVFDDTVSVMTDMSRALGQDTKSSAIQLGKAMNDPIKGISALSRVGVSFTADQKKLIKTLVASGDTMGAQKVILAELNKEFGGSGQAYAATYAGKIDALKDAFGDLGEAGTKKLMPFLGRIAEKGAKGFDWATKWVTAAHKMPPAMVPVVAGFKGIAEKSRSAWGGLELLVKGDYDPKHWAPGIDEDAPIVKGLIAIRKGSIEAGSAIKGHLVAGFEKVAPIFTAVGGTLGKAFISVFQTLAPVFKELLPSLSSLWVLFNPISVLFKALLPVLPQIAEVIGELAKILAQGLAAALRAVMPLFKTIAGVIQQLLPFVTSLIKSLLPPLVSLFKSLSPAIKAILDAIIPLIAQLVKFLIPVIKALVPVFKTAFKIIADVVGTLIKVFKGVIDFITAVFTGKWSKAWDAVKRIFKAVWEGIQKVVKGVWEAIQGIVKVAWERFLKPIWQKGIQPALVALGGFFTKLWEKVRDVWGWIRDKIRDVWVWIRDHIFTPIGTFIAKIGGWFSNLLRKVREVWDAILDKIRSVWDWLSKYVFGPIGTAIGAVGTAIGVVWTAIKGAWSAIKGFFSDVRDAIKEAWDFIVKAVTGIGNAIATFLGIGEGTNPLTGKGYFDGLLKPPGGARGAVVAGTDPGRRDNRIMAVRSGEAIMVPEWTRAVGGAPAVEKMNRAAERGTLAGMARGGVVNLDDLTNTRDMGTFLVSKGADQLAANPWVGLVPGLSAAFSGLARAFAAGKDPGDFTFTAPLGGVDAGLLGNQDPSSFGWTRASNIVPYAYHGLSFAGGVAGGTQSLWNALLDRVVPLIPGGLISGDLFGYENRDNVNNPGMPSFHSYGLALDLNSAYNANGSPPGTGRYQLPPAVSAIAKALGFLWGGDFTGTPDPMHLELHRAASGVSGGGLSGAPMGGNAGGRFLTDIPAVMTREAFDQLAKNVMVVKGFDPVDSYIPTNQADHESSFRTNVFNMTDRNAAAGDPSGGILQFIKSTFNSNKDPGFGEFLGPEDQLHAFLNYVPATYSKYNSSHQGLGYLEQIGYSAYDGGGVWPSKTGGVNLTNGPEYMLTPPQWDVARQALDAIPPGGGETILEIHTHIGDRELGDVVRITVQGVLTDVGGQFRRANVQSEVGVA